MKKRVRVIPLLVCLLIPTLVGALSGFLISSKTKPVYDTILLPPGAPPSWLFGVIWTILYLVIGFASYLVLVSGEDDRVSALSLYGISLGLLLPGRWCFS